MKSYEVNYVAKVATITKKTTPAEKRMLERMGLKLEMKKERARPSYNQIEIFISYLENGLEMMEEFETQRGLSLSEDACYEKVLDWFNETFPYYGGPYTFNSDHKITGPKLKDTKAEQTDNVTLLPETKTA